MAIALSVCFGALTLCAAGPKPLVVKMMDGKGQSVGTATISAKKSGQGVDIKLDLHGLPPGDHALHIHAVAKCEGPAFTTATGHFNPLKRLPRRSPRLPSPWLTLMETIILMLRTSAQAGRSEFYSVTAMERFKRRQLSM